MGVRFRKHYLILGLVELILLYYVIQFMLFNNLNIQDMIGHYFNALYASETWPYFMGWNPYHFLGYAPLQSYPPLFTILTVLLGYILPLKLAFKAVLGISLLATPLSFYYFTRKLGFDELKASVAALGMVSAMFFIQDYVGGTMYSTFNAGLVTTALSIPLLFFYLGILKDSFESGRYVIPSVLMALVVLSHVFTAMVAALISVCFLAVQLNKKNIIFYLKHALLSFLLCSFWFVPMVLGLGDVNSVHFGPKMHIWWMYYVVLFGFIAVSYIRSRDVKPVYWGMLVLCLIFVLGDFIPLKFHFYRLTLFIVFFMIVVGVNFVKKRSSLLIIGLLFIILIFANTGNLHPKGMPDIRINDFGRVDGRVLVLNHIDYEIGWHTLPYKVQMVTGNEIIKGLNIDTAKNGFLIGEFVKMIDPEAYIMYNDLFPMYNFDKNISLLPKQLDLLNINYIVAQNLSFGERLEDVYDGYYLYRVGDSSFAEVLDYKPIVVEDFDGEAFRWFFEDAGRVLVNEEVPDNIGAGNETVEVLERGRNTIRLFVDSDQPVPVLVKMTYSKKWKAYSNGNEVRIYEVSPGLVLVYGGGEVILSWG